MNKLQKQLKNEFIKLMLERNIDVKQMPDEEILKWIDFIYKRISNTKK